MPIKIFFCYAHEDEALLNQLKRHLRQLQRQGLIEMWHDRDINPGIVWEQEINKHLNEAQIILLLISPAFMDSDYCYDIEMPQAVELHKRGDAHVIPIILSYVSWKDAPFGKLHALPKDAKPVKSWQDQDEALCNIVEGITALVSNLSLKSHKSLEEKIEEPQELVDEVFKLGYLAGGGKSFKNISNVKIIRNEDRQILRYQYDES